MHKPVSDVTTVRSVIYGFKCHKENRTVKTKYWMNRSAEMKSEFLDFISKQTVVEMWRHFTHSQAEGSLILWEPDCLQHISWPFSFEMFQSGQTVLKLLTC